MKVKRGIMFFLGIALVIISGCGAFLPSNANTGSISKGLELEFIPNNPPLSLKGEEDFQVGIKLENSFIKPVNYELCIFEGNQNYGGIGLRVCERRIIEGANVDSNGFVTSNIDRVWFPDEESTYQYINPQVSSNTIRAELIYPIKINPKVDVCVVQFPNLEQDSKEICVKSNENFISINIDQESAPVSVSRIEKIMSRSGGNNKIDLKIHLNKISDGEIVDNDDNLNLLDMGVFLGNNKFDCDYKNGKVVFREGFPIECDIIVERPGSNYLEGLRIDLSYIYKLGDSVTIKYVKEDNIV